MESVEMHNANRLREIGKLIENVCNTAEANRTQFEIAQLAAGYFKAQLHHKDLLADVLETELRHALEGYPFRSLETLCDCDMIDITQLAFSRDYSSVLGPKVYMG